MDCPRYTVYAQLRLASRSKLLYMVTYISPEQQAKILSAIKTEGMSTPDAAKTFMITENTIKK